MGWARANMLYDLATEPPEPGTLLESAFLLMAKKRQEIRFHETRFLAEAAMRPHVEDGKSFQEAYQDYADAIFPFTARDRELEKTKAKDIMQQWTSHKALRVKPLWRPQEHKGIISRMKKAAQKVVDNESKRRGVKI